MMEPNQLIDSKEIDYYWTLLFWDHTGEEEITNWLNTCHASVDALELTALSLT